METLADFYERNKAWAKPGPYFTKLPKKQEKEFQQWVKDNNVPFEDGEQADYDMRGFFKALKEKDPRATTAVNPNDNRMHFPDVWKTPYHHSFSAESQYSTGKAPSWNSADQLVTPSGIVTFDERTKLPKAMGVSQTPAMGSPLTLAGQYGINQMAVGQGDQNRKMQIPTAPGLF